MNRNHRSLLIVVAIVLLAIFGLNMVGGGGSPFGGEQASELGIGELRSRIDAGEVDTLILEQGRITGKLSNGQQYYMVDTNLPEGSKDSIIALAEEKKLNPKSAPTPASASILPILSILLPLLFLGVLVYFLFIRNSQSGGNQAMNFGRSKAKRAGETNVKVTFADVAGIDEAKQELEELVDFLRNTKKYSNLGARIPKGVLLTGPPGVGKTHLARAVAGEAGVPFFHISGSDFVEMFVGVGAARVRDLFETAKAHKPCLIFIDEIDAVGRQRGAGMGGGHDEREQTLNQLLVEMDGFDANSGVIMIAATNRPDVLDPALLRPGRFDRQIVVDSPDVVGREKILHIHAKGKPLLDEVKMEVIAKRTVGFTGADLANSLNEAALLAARRNLDKIGMPEIEEALDRVMAGPQRKSMAMSPEERRYTAYHEAGHAIVGEVLKHEDKLHKVTILPRGRSLGAAWYLPDRDKYQVTESTLRKTIAKALGGIVAEELIFNDITTGASSDLQHVASIARSMVTKYGMSSKLGPLAFGKSSSNPFLGRDYNDARNYSEDVAKMIDEEVRAIVEEGRASAEEVLRTHREQLESVSQALLDRETLDREEFLMLMEGKTLPALKPMEPPKPSGDGLALEESSSSAPRLEPGPASG